MPMNQKEGKTNERIIERPNKGGSGGVRDFAGDEPPVDDTGLLGAVRQVVVNVVVDDDDEVVVTGNSGEKTAQGQ